MGLLYTSHKRYVWDEDIASTYLELMREHVNSIFKKVDGYFLGGGKSIHWQVSPKEECKWDSCLEKSGLVPLYML